MNHEPRRHLIKPKGLKSIVHPCVKRPGHMLKTLGITGLAAILMGALLLMMVVNNLPVTARPSEMAQLTFLWIQTLVAWPAFFMIRMFWTARTTDEEAMSLFRSECINHAHPNLEQYGESGKISAHDLKCILDNHHRRYSTVRRTMILRIAEAVEAVRKAVMRFGTADKTPAMKAYVQTVEAIVAEAKADMEAIRSGLEQSDRHEAVDAMHELVSSLDAARSLDPRIHARGIAGTAASTRIGGLIEMGERAIALDPEMVDANGGRIDVLIRKHLPRTLARYADIASMPGGATQRDRDALEQGITMIARSIQEGIASMRSEKADALRTEIRFLASRRGEDADEAVREIAA